MKTTQQNIEFRSFLEKLLLFEKKNYKRNARFCLLDECGVTKKKQKKTFFCYKQQRKKIFLIYWFYFQKKIQINLNEKKKSFKYFRDFI